MAAYAALVSLMHIIDTLEKHPSPPISIDKQQVESLTQNVTFLQEFLDGYISPVVVDGREADPLECRIADAVYAVEDVIESRIALQINGPPPPPRTIRENMISCITCFLNSLRGVCKCVAATTEEDLCHELPRVTEPTEEVTETTEENFYHDLQQVIEEMNLIKKQVMETAAVAQLQIAVDEAQLQQKTVAASTSSSTANGNMMTGFDHVFLEVLDELTGDQLNRQIIPITGMGGIGKTTLAKNLFENARVKEHFDIRAWTTISQTYDVREKLRELYIQASGHPSENEKMSDSNENAKLNDVSEIEKLDVNQLGGKLYQFLFGRRYFIIMDDIWGIEAWDKIKFFFPANENGSRIIITTRESYLSSLLNKSYRVAMKFLDGDSSWALFCKTVFGKETCPVDLENIGKNIVAHCKGLPLSIAMIGGLLSKSVQTSKHWKLIEKNLNSTLIDSNDEFCLKILRMSYIYLPNYLKPCFLYMGVFKEDHRIRVSMLMKLWVSCGFLKPRSKKCLETTAQEYFKELVDRNLILVDELGSIGNVKYCKIHDLLRNLCLKEVQKDRFYYHNHDEQLSDNLRLLRTFKTYAKDFGTVSGDYFLSTVYKSLNSRYHAIGTNNTKIVRLWNLHTLIIYGWNNLIAPVEIWKLHQLQHLVFVGGNKILPNPPSDDNDIVVMENMHTLKGVVDLDLNEDVVKRIPNVKKLHVLYEKSLGENCLSYYLQCLSKLENLHCTAKFMVDHHMYQIRFPHSLKKLSITVSYNMHLDWNMMSKVGSLPLLQKLVIKRGIFGTRKWETTEGQFPSLKFLKLENCWNLENWIVPDKSCFPLLEKLYLSHLDKLEEIPSEVGEIVTLKSICLIKCSKSAVMSAKKIVDEQEDYGNQDLHVRVEVAWANNQDDLKSLASDNFEVKVILS